MQWYGNNENAETLYVGGSKMHKFSKCGVSVCSLNKWLIIFCYYKGKPIGSKNVWKCSPKILIFFFFFSGHGKGLEVFGTRLIIWVADYLFLLQ